MRSGEERSVSTTGMIVIVATTAAAYIVGCLLFFFPIAFFYGPSWAADPPVVEVAISICILDLLWATALWMGWPIKSKRMRIGLSIVIYTLSAAILTCFYVHHQLQAFA